MTETKTATAVPTKEVDAVKKALDAAQHALDSARASMDQASGGTESLKRGLTSRADELLEEAKTNLAEAKELMANLAAKAREQAEALFAATSEQYSELVGRARGLRDKARGTVADLEVGRRRDDLVDFVRENPAKSALVALAIGFLGGYLARKRG